MVRVVNFGRRFVATALLGFLSLGAAIQPPRAVAQDVARTTVVPMDKALSSSTILYIQVENAKELRAAIEASSFGKLLSDPAMQPLLEDVKKRLEEASEKTTARLGMSLEELLELPQGPMSLALMPRPEGGDMPVTAVLAAEAGANADKMAQVMEKLTQVGRDDGNFKVTEEDFAGTKLTLVQGPDVESPIVWTRKGSVFFISTGMAELKDLLSSASGREDSLSSRQSYQKIREKTATDGAQVSWYLDFEQIFKLAGKLLESRGGGNVEQVQAQLELTGLSGLKGVGGSVAMNVGPYETLSKAFLYSPGEAQGILRLFSMPTVDLKPESWVPDTVASYQTISWDIDNAYKALSDLADTLAPGVLAAVEQNLAGPQGEGLKFEGDITGPLGDRVTIVSDFRKPITEDSQRVLFAVSLEDPKAFQSTLNKIMELTNAQPKKREFQGVTIYDFDLPEIPNAEVAGIKGAVSLAIAKDHVFFATDSTLLEQILRGGGSPLAESADYQAVARQFPATSSTLSYQQPDEQARALYDMFKSGQLKAAFEEGARNAGGNADVPELIDPEKVPDFSVFAKYLTPGGGYSVMEPEGLNMFQFSIKQPATP